MGRQKLTLFRQRLNLGSISSADAEQLLTQHMPLVRGVARLYPYADQDELQSAGRLAIMEATLTHDPAKGRNINGWVRQVVHWRLSEAAAATFDGGGIKESLGVDPPVLNGANPEEAFLRATAVRALSRLTPRHQIIVTGRMRGETYSEIGVTIGVSTSRTQAEGQRAYKLLRSILEDGDGV
jgi:RNA polymerase sigma factor (sigma-70 family)